MNTSSRRSFLAASSASVLAFPTFVPASAFGANDRVRVGCVGIGGKGHVDTLGTAAAGGEIAAICDVADPKNPALARKGKKNDIPAKFPDATFHRDFRQMIDSEDLDAVTVSTPDHTHANAAVMAMRKGLHVYCQKPLTHSIWEARLMTEVAAETGVKTQMGNQAHAGEPIRRAVELVRAGIIGPVHEVHAWTNRPIWPQGMAERPAAQPVPDGLDWDLWLGPAPACDYNKAYAPFTWRGWWDFGTGALGDMGCHIMDMPYWALELGAPTTVEATQKGNTAVSGPNESVVTYRFAARGPQPAVTFKWYDGGAMPEDEVLDFDLPTREHITRRFDLVLVGKHGKMAFGRTRQDWLVHPEGANKEFEEPPRTLPRVAGGKEGDTRGQATGGPYKEWLDAVRGGGRALSDFAHAGPFTEMVLLGNLAVRLGKKLEWDSANLRATNAPEADSMIRRERRKGWELD